MICTGISVTFLNMSYKFYLLMQMKAFKVWNNKRKDVKKRIQSVSYDCKSLQVCLENVHKIPKTVYKSNFTLLKRIIVFCSRLFSVCRLSD